MWSDSDDLSSGISGFFIINLNVTVDVFCYLLDGAHFKDLPHVLLLTSSAGSPDTQVVFHPFTAVIIRRARGTGSAGS